MPPGGKARLSLLSGSTDDCEQRIDRARGVLVHRFSADYTRPLQPRWRKRAEGKEQAPQGGQRRGKDRKCRCRLVANFGLNKVGKRARSHQPWKTPCDRVRGPR